MQAMFRPLRLCALLTACGVLASCSEGPPAQLSGYIEGEFVRIAAPFGGALTRLHVKRGQMVAAGVPVFSLEQENESSARKAAEERLRSAQAQLDDLKKGKRAEELDVLQAQLAQSVAMEKVSAAQLDSNRKLVEQGYVSKIQQETALANNQRDRARIAELQNQIKVSQLGGRPDQIRFQQAEVDAARAALRQTDWQLRQKSITASRAGLVFDTMYMEGEWVGAGNPVVSILPPGAVKVRFFVPQAMLGKLRVGQEVSVHCDGCDGAVAARISYISPQAEYTPPVIYSKDARGKLVFLVEAYPGREDDALRLHPGQPVDIGIKS